MNSEVLANNYMWKRGRKQMTIHNVLLKHLAPHHDICYYSGEIRFFYHNETKDQQSFKDILWSSCKVN